MNEVPKDDLARRAALEARLLARRRPGTDGGIVPIPRDSELLPVSAAQRRMWVYDQLVERRSANNVSQGYRLRGPVSVPDLSHAFDRVVARHETLRFCFRMDGSDLVTEPAARLPALEHVCLPLPEADRDVAVQDLYGRLQAGTFDLARDPPVRAVLQEFAADDFFLSCTFHHIACDEWSIRRFLSELAAQYDASCRGADPAVPPLPIQYADYAAWQKAGLAEGRWSEAEAYWKARLAGVPQTVPLPRAARDRGLGGGGEALKHRFVLPPETARALDGVAGALHATPFMAMLAATLAFLHRSAGKEDLAVSSLVAARARPELDGLIGMFTNNVVIRSQAASGMRFRELLAATRDHVLDALRYQDYPFDAVLRTIDIERAEAPFSDVMFTHRNAFGDPLSVTGIRSEPVGEKAGPAKFGLWVSILDDRGTRHVQLVGDGDLYTPQTLSEVAREFADMLRDLAGAPDAALDLGGPGPAAPASASLADPAAVAVERPVPADTEQTVAGIWEAVLRRPPDSPRTSFFDVGGDSLLLLQLVQRLSQTTGARLSMSAAFAHATVEGHARLVEDARAEARAEEQAGDIDAPASVAPGPGEAGDPAIIPLGPPEPASNGPGQPFFIVSGAGGHVLPFAPSARRLAGRWNGYGILDPGFFNDAQGIPTLGGVAEWMLQRATPVAPDPPLLLVGYSYGAHVAFEMAARARAIGRPVGLVILDTRARAALPEGRAKRLYLLARSRTRPVLNRMTEVLRGRGAPADPAGRLYDEPRRRERKYRKAIADRQRVLLMRHRPRPVDMPLVVIRAREQIRPDDPEDYGWSALARVVAVHDVDGSHLDLFKGAREAEFAAILDTALDVLDHACGGER